MLIAFFVGCLDLESFDRLYDRTDNRNAERLERKREQRLENNFTFFERYTHLLSHDISAVHHPCDAIGYRILLRTAQPFYRFILVFSHSYSHWAGRTQLYILRLICLLDIAFLKVIYFDISRLRLGEVATE